MKRFRLLALSAAVILSGTVLAYAAGLWPTYPIVGSAAFCAGQSTGVTSQVCTTTVPAGPTIVTGNELIPADTAKAGGSQPQTVRLSMGSLNALPITVQTITTVAPTVSAANNSGGVLFHSGATITTASIWLPQSPIDGQQYAVATDRTISTLTMSAGALTMANTGLVTGITPTVVPGSSGVRYLYNLALGTWFRIQ